MTLTVQSTWDGLMVASAMRRDQAERLLPKGFELATPGADHLMLIFSGRHHQLQYTWGGGAMKAVWPIFADQYREHIALIPCVVKKGETTPHNFILRMVLDHWLPVFWGNALFAYRKELGSIDRALMQSRPHDCQLTKYRTWQEIQERMRDPIYGTKVRHGVAHRIVRSRLEIDFAQGAVETLERSFSQSVHHAYGSRWRLQWSPV